MIFRNIGQSERVQAEREIKHLQNQNVVLERDIWRRDSLGARMRDSKSSDYNRQKGVNMIEQNLQVRFLILSCLNLFIFHMILCQLIILQLL